MKGKAESGKLKAEMGAGEMSLLTSAATSSAATQMLTRKQVQWIMQVSESTVDDWRRRRALDFFATGDVIRCHPAALLRFIQEHTLTARSSPSPWPSPPGEGRLSDGDWLKIERLIEARILAVLGAKGSPEGPAEVSLLTSAATPRAATEEEAA